MLPRAKTVVVIPTYNENENIKKLIPQILDLTIDESRFEFELLIVDDKSPDGTGKTVKNFQKNHPNIQLIEGNKEGLGAAYQRGFAYAIEELNADIIFQMDGDLSHDPKKIPVMLEKIAAGYDFVIGSRHTKGGSLDPSWPLHRILNTKVANLVAKTLLSLWHIADVTSGYRAIRTDLLKKFDYKSVLNDSHGYVIMVNLIYNAYKNGAKFYEIPIHFRDREYGKSKIRFYDVYEFLKFCLVTQIKDTTATFSIWKVVTFSAVFLFILLLTQVYVDQGALVTFITGISILLTVQGLFTLYWMTYAWDDPVNTANNKAPLSYSKPKNSFTAFVPALHEADVIGHTIESINAIDYPDELKELLVIIPSHDIETIEAATKVKEKIGKENIRIIADSRPPKNKPYQLNYGLEIAQKDVIVIFDAEDEPSRDIFNIVNTVIENDQADVVQSGVQLINYRSRWFSAINVLEYFFWFKSALHMFSKNGVVPLGGNTVFFKKKWLEKVGGWDDTCLTEDADIGINLSLNGAKFRIIYDEKHATLEETPLDIATFIKQRTRWNQGFLQIFLKGDWRQFPTLQQKLFAAYILISQVLLASLILYIPFSLYSSFFLELPIQYALISMAPMYVLIMMAVTASVALYEFARLYNLPFPIWMPIKIFITFIPYTLLLMFSAFRATYRLMTNELGWEKTKHVGIHREISR